MHAPTLPVAVIGGGPIGLAAAAHLLERGLEPLVFEAGTRPGASVADWGHVRMFSPWSFNIDRAAERLLRRRGWTPPEAQAHPTGHDLLREYIEPLAATPELAPRLHLATTVAGLSRHHVGKVRDWERLSAPFSVRLRRMGGTEETHLASAVIDASGTWTNPATAGADGLPAIGERDPAVMSHVHYGMPDILGDARDRYADRTVAVIGSGHSAMGCLLDLVELSRTAPGTKVIWLLRQKDLKRIYGGGARDALAARGAIGERLRDLVEGGRIQLRKEFLTERITRDRNHLKIGGYAGDRYMEVEADRLIVATGFRPDLSFLSEIRIDLDPALECPRALAPLIDPNLHSCGTVRPHGALELVQPEANFFIAGMKSYGRAPTFLLATGHEQVRSIAAHLGGDEAASRRFELTLPQTGVCTTALLPSGDQTATAGTASCRRPDAKDDAAGVQGRGCSASTPKSGPFEQKSGCCGAS